jgi:hypothetical protein
MQVEIGLTNVVVVMRVLFMKLLMFHFFLYDNGGGALQLRVPLLAILNVPSLSVKNIYS